MDPLLENQSSSTQKRKLFSIIFFTIFLTLILSAIISVFALLKRQTESQSMSSNPARAIHACCSLTTYNFRCTESLSPLHNPARKIHASDVFCLSIHAAFYKLVAIHALKMDCRRLLGDSLGQLNRSMIVIMDRNRVGPDFDDGVIGELRGLMGVARGKVRRCLEDEREGVGKMREKVREVERQILIGLEILEKKDFIREVFDPSLQSVLASFMLDRENYVVSVGVLCSQYVFLVFLICSLLRFFK